MLLNKIIPCIKIQLGSYTGIERSQYIAHNIGLERKCYKTISHYINNVNIIIITKIAIANGYQKMKLIC